MDKHETLLKELRLQNRILKICLMGAGCVMLMAAASTNRASFDEIDVHRINVLSDEGKRELVIANRTHLPGPVINGKELPDERKMAGLIFYNQEGDESGGLTWKGGARQDGGASQAMHFSMDRYGGDQQLALVNYEKDGHMLTGLRVFDRGLQKDYGPFWVAMQKLPDGLEREAAKKKWEEAGGLQTDRVFVGRTAGKSSAVILSDARGHDRIVMLVSPEGNAVFDFLDENGKVVKSLAPK